MTFPYRVCGHDTCHAQVRIALTCVTPRPLALLGYGASTGQAGNATILLYVAVTYAAQRLVAQARAARIPARDGV